MTSYQVRYPVVRAAVVASIITLAISVAAAEPGRIKINYTACDDQVNLVTTNAMLSDVLQALATDLHFDLHFKSDNDRPISVNLSEPAAKLIKVLGRDDSILITNSVDASCDEPVDRLMAVWFFGSGPEVAYRPATALSIDKLPETGEVQARTDRKSIIEGDEADKAGMRQTRRKHDMSPEERYNEKIARRAAKEKY